MPVLFAATLFLSATLLFLIQPMIAKMMLPKLGGTPAVWNTCMVFFQALLLAGYSYAHATTAWLGTRGQALVHSGVLFLPLLVMPIAVAAEWVPPSEANPIPWLLGLLLISVGLPFFVVSTSAPLLQKWFAGTGHPAAGDPYFLYAASNLGSMLALVAYPMVIEPTLPLQTQSWIWAAGYGFFVFCASTCAFLLWRSAADERFPAPKTTCALEGDAKAPTLRTRLHWVALAFVPSSLMLGVTTYLSTDIASIPLIWVVPLALYLLSFILVFARLPGFIHTSMVLLMPVLVLLQVFLMYTDMTQRTSVVIGMHLLTLFTAAMVCHGELAHHRPATRYLTEFYLWMSFGGVLGGLFNALVAPLVFKTVFEYPLVMIIACLLMPRLDDREVTPVTRGLDVLAPLSLFLITFWLLKTLDPPGGTDTLRNIQEYLRSIAEKFNWDDYVPSSLYRLRRGLQFGIPILLCYVLVARPLRFGLGLGAIVLGASFYSIGADTDVVFRDRSFFGVLKLERSDDSDEQHNYHRLVHGTTLHGMQRIALDGNVWKPVHNSDPLTYYHRTGPIGHVFAAIKKDNDKRPIALVGLGTGTLACYAEPDQEATFFEIDPAVERIARNPNYFTNLEDALERKAKVNVVLGDARLSLRDKAEDGRFRLIVLDAFSSDAIPVHLITREALQLYIRKLTPDGIIAFHISNRYLDLRPVLANLAKHANLAAWVEHDDKEEDEGKSSSTWVILAHDEKDFRSLRDDLKLTKDDDEHHWRRLEDDLSDDDKEHLIKDVGLWTDDFSNILSIFLWK